jgi:hypothetical protein
MYRYRNLDIFIAGGAALLGGAAYVVHAPGPVQVVLGVILFFTPGYLWSEAILSQRLSGIERTLTTAGLSLILPILGGFLFYGLHIPLFRSAWVGLLVVLTLLGVVAVAVVRLREQPEPVDPRPRPRGNQPPPRRFPAGQVAVFGLAGVIGLGSVGFSVHSAETQKYAGYTMLWMTAAKNSTVKASLGVTNHQGVAEEYQLKLLEKGKVTTTWKFVLSDGQTWDRTIAYTLKYSMVADLYLLPDGTKPYRMVDNGQ